MPVYSFWYYYTTPPHKFSRDISFQHTLFSTAKNKAKMQQQLPHTTPHYYINTPEKPLQRRLLKYCNVMTLVKLWKTEDMRLYSE